MFFAEVEKDFFRHDLAGFFCQNLGRVNLRAIDWKLAPDQIAKLDATSYTAAIYPYGVNAAPSTNATPCRFDGRLFLELNSPESHALVLRIKLRGEVRNRTKSPIQNTNRIAVLLAFAMTVRQESPLFFTAFQCVH